MLAVYVEVGERELGLTLSRSHGPRKGNHYFAAITRLRVGLDPKLDRERRVGQDLDAIRQNNRSLLNDAMLAPAGIANRDLEPTREIVRVPTKRSRSELRHAPEFTEERSGA
jgi:hypothetical protein